MEETSEELPNFFISIDLLGPDPKSSKNKAEKNSQVACFANLSEDQHIEEKNKQYQNVKSEMEKLKKKTLEGRQLKTGMVELNRVLDENSRKHQERLEEASQAFLKAETDSVKEMKSMLAREKQRVERLKRAMATLKISGERIKKRNENLNRRNRQLLARVNELRTKDKKNSTSAGTSRCCKARDDEQSWSTDSDEEE